MKEWKCPPPDFNSLNSWKGYRGPFFIEGWGLVAAGVAGSIVSAGISSGAFTGGQGGQGQNAALAGFNKKALAALDKINLGDAPTPVAALQYTPTQFDTQKLTQGSKKSPYSTVKKPGWQPVFQRDKAGNVLYKDGKPLINKNSQGQAVYVDPKVLTVKTDGKGNPIKDSNGHALIDTSAPPNFKDAGYKNEVQKGSKDLYGSKLKQVPYVSTVDKSRLNSDPQKAVDQTGEMSGFHGNLSEQAQQETEFQKQQRESVAPGSGEMMTQGGKVINSWLKGEVPQDVAQSIQSAAASQFGATTNPFLSGGPLQGSSAAMLKNLGLTSTSLQQTGVSASQSWQQLSEQLTTKIGDVYSRASDQQKTNYAYDALATSTSLEVDARNYSANVNNNIIKHSPDPQAVGYLNDFLKLTSLNDQNNLTTALNKQQTDLVNSQILSQFNTNSANLDLAKVSASLGLAPSQLPQSNINGQLIGAGIQSSQSSLPIIQSLLNRKRGLSSPNYSPSNNGGWQTSGGGYWNPNTTA